MKSKKLNERPMVSIMMLAYNHGEYIRQALDGILMQEVDFAYEIIVGEDCSQDSTRAILLEYKEKYPDRIKLILHEKNVGMNGNLNAVRRQCTGKYVAACEGDDYWVNPDKLKIQVEFLERNLKYIGTAHRVQVVDECGNLKNDFNLNAYCQDEIYTIKHVEKGILPGQLATLVYRNILASDPSAMNALENCSAVGDRVTALYLALNGDIYCFNKVMSHYRYVTNHGDSWSARTAGKNIMLYTFNYHRELEVLAKELKNVEVDFTTSYVSCGSGALKWFLKSPNRENFEILKEIYTNYENKITMSFHILKRCIISPFSKVKRLFLQSVNS